MIHVKPVTLTRIPYDLEPRKFVLYGTKFKTLKKSKTRTCCKLCLTEGLGSLNKRKALLY